MAFQKSWSRLVLSKFALVATVFILFSACEYASSEGTIKPMNTEGLETIIEPTQLFLKYCESCHGMNGDKGVSGAGNLKEITLTDLQIRNVILRGTPNGMMSFEGQLNDQQIAALIEYVKMLKYK